MDIIVRNITVVQPGSEIHDQKLDLYIKDGVIAQVGKVDPCEAQEIDATGKFVSPGWFDLRAQYADPGQEHREDLYSGLNCASAGGFTGVAVLPNTYPVVQTKESVSYLIQKSGRHLVDLYPIGAVTKDTKGTELTEMMDMKDHGAIAFSDGVHSIWHTGILLKSLQYVNSFNSLIINNSRDLYLSKDGQVHEGVYSTLNGMKGIPEISETLAIQKDLEVLRYTGGRLHFSLISSAKAVELIDQAKKEGLEVTCDVSAQHLVLNDELIGEFDTNHKENPPYRSEEDRQALIKGVKSGVIDCVVSDHTPIDEEGKKLEYDYAEFGTISQELVFSLLSEILSPAEITTCLSTKPRTILGLPTVEIKEGATANLTIFDLDQEWEYANSKSKSKNTPFLGANLKGKVVGVYNNGQWQPQEA